MFKPYVGIAIAVATAVALGGAFYLGGKSERDAAKAEARKQIVDQMTERGKIDDEVQGMSPATLCLRLGGVWNNGKCE